MILIHLLTGLVFGVTSVIFSIYAGHGFFTGLLRYSVFGAGGMCLSAALSMIPLSAVVQLAAGAFRPDARSKPLLSRSSDLRGRGGFPQDVGQTQEM